MKLQLNKHNRKGFTLIELMVVIAILAALAAVGYGPIMDHMGDGDRQAASSNMTNVHNTLISFKQEHGSFPCDQTANKLLKKDLKIGDLTGDYANPYYRQLFYKDRLKDEKLFYAKIPGFVEGDGTMAQGQALIGGENAFAYVVKKGKDNSHATVSEQTAPIMFSCVAASDKPYGGDDVLFDMEAFRKHAFMLTVDGRVTDLLDKVGWEDSSEDTTKPAKSLFPQNISTGDSTGSKYLVLPPEPAA